VLKPVKCPKCELLFEDYVGLGYHLHHVHGLTWADSERAIKKETVRHV
jgi:uncharacterized C2H2 Zn-finger protein